MRILVTGGDGMLGRAVVEGLTADHEVQGVDLVDGDLTVAAEVAQVFAAHRPTWVIHCAAWTDVDGAETHRESALAANATATELVARQCRTADCGLTYISTDYVFNGRGGDGAGYDEDDERDPINHYGLTKARGEEAVAALPGAWQIVRTSWLFGDGQVNFVKTIRRLLGECETLRVVDDQKGCPTYAPDLADVLGFLVSGGHRGIFHGTNRGHCSWFEFACEIARCSGLDPRRIQPCASDEFPRPAKRPTCSILRSRRLEEVRCPSRPDWREATRRYCARLAAGAVAHP